MTKVQSLILSVIVLIGHRADGYAVSGTTYTTNGSASDVQSAINSCPQGGTVIIPAGRFNWGTSASTVTITGKGLTLQGAGASSTTITANGPLYSFGGVLQLNVTGAKQSIRVTGIYFSGGWSVGVTGPPGNAVYRIDDCTFDGNTATEAGSPSMLSIDGGGWGLIDHCTFTAGGAAEMIHDSAYTPGNNGGWVNDVNPGTYQFVYLENDTFICTGTPYNTGCGSTYGAQDVIRYCSFQYSKLDRHGDSGKPSNYGSRWYEVYDNTFNDEGENQAQFMELRDGSGVVFDNTATRTGTGGGSIDVTEDVCSSAPCSGAPYPILCQIGQGLGSLSTNLSPLYFWGNDSTLTGAIYSGNSTYVDEGRDFILVSNGNGLTIRQRASDGNGTTYNYVPYTYPYPLTAAGLPNPSGSAPAPVPTPLAPTMMRFVTPKP